MKDDKPPVAQDAPSLDTLLLAAARVVTFEGQRILTNASGFFFQRDERLFLVTSRHVMIDEPTHHYPDRLEIELHTDRRNMAQSIGFSMPLYRDGKSAWRQGRDGGGDVDVAVLEIERGALPVTAVYRAFRPEHLLVAPETIEIGSSLLVVGFPLGFHDALHHLPVVRHAVNASPYGLRFQGKGYFLTDARTHRGTSGAPVVLRSRGDTAEQSDLPWKLLGIHSSRMDVGTRDLTLDEALGLNCAWYADILLTLTNHHSNPTHPPMPS